LTLLLSPGPSSEKAVVDLGTLPYSAKEKKRTQRKASRGLAGIKVGHTRKRSSMGVGKRDGRGKGLGHNFRERRLNGAYGGSLHILGGGKVLLRERAKVL